MPEQFFVRRGITVQGPMPKDRLIAAFKAGKLRPSDEIAGSPNGPWRPAGEAFRRPAPEIPVVESFAIKKSLFGSRYLALYECRHCRAPLQSDESEWSAIETCPNCGKRYRISPRAAEQAAAERRRLLDEKATADAAVTRVRAEKAAAREAIAARRAEERQLAGLRHQADETARQAAEVRAVQAAHLARRRSGVCWYCGGPLAPGFIQCRFCHMLPQDHMPVVAGHTSGTGVRANGI